MIRPNFSKQLTVSSRQLIRLLLTAYCTLLYCQLTNSQNVDIGTIGKGKAFKISGGISANSTPLRKVS